MAILRLKPQKVILPAIFALLLGIGNIYVGYERQDANSESLHELESVQPLPAIADSSPLMRMQFTRLSEEKQLQRRKTAQERVEFYQLVVLGGKALCLLSLCLFSFGLFLTFSSQSPQIEPPHAPEA